MPSSSCVDALDEPPNQLRTLPCRNCASTCARVHTPRFAHEIEHRAGLCQRESGHTVRALRGCIRWCVARGTQTVVDEEVFLDRQLRIEAFEITGTVAGDAVAQRQVLRPCRRTDRVGLHEAEALDGLGQRRRREQAARDGMTSQVGEVWCRHGRPSCPRTLRSAGC